jgi:choline-sulfatase
MSLQESPNLILFITDDHAQWALGCYGNREIHTPALDYLAGSGVLMRNAFTPCPVCSPARASLLTGLYPSQHGIHDYIDSHIEEYDRIDRLGSTPTLASLLSAQGYTVGLVGKWHCGQEGIPARGFDFWFSVGKHAMSGHHGQHDFYEGDEPAIHSDYKTDLFAEKVVEFLRTRPKDRPFFLLVAFTGTHSPWSGHPDYLAAQHETSAFADIPADAVYPFGAMAGEATFKTRDNRRAALAQYYAAVEHIDIAVGRILNELDTQQINQQTALIYTADHGLNASHHGLWGKTNSTRPPNMLEESIRVPLIVRWPGQIVAGQQRAEMIDHTDLFETILALVGVTFARDRDYVGRSFLPLLRGGYVRDWKRTQIIEYVTTRMIRDERFKLVTRLTDDPPLFIDLQADPRETVNRMDAPEHQLRITALRNELDAFFARLLPETNGALDVTALPPHNRVEWWR